MQKFIFLLLAASLNMPALFAQSLVWDHMTYELPVSSDPYKPLYHTFTFRNTGDTVVTIRNVLPGSNISIDNYTKGSIPPNGKGYLKATLTPAGMKGAFLRTITVHTDEKARNEYILTLKGELSLEEDPMTDIYPLSIGHLRYKPFYQLFFNLKITEIRTDTIFVYNAWDKEMQLRFDSLPPFLALTPVPAMLKPKSEGYLLVTYKPAKRNDFDMVFDKVKLTTNDQYEPEKTLDIIAVIVDDFDVYKDQDTALAPAATFNVPEYDFGSIRQGSIVRYTLQLTNTGQDTLIIRKTSTSCGCTVSKPEKDRLSPGESTDIPISFNTFGRHGAQSITVRVLTNDPRNPSQLFTLKGVVN